MEESENENKKQTEPETAARRAPVYVFTNVKSRREKGFRMHERSTNLIGIEFGIVDEFQVRVDSRGDQTTDERPEPVLTKRKRKKKRPIDRSGRGFWNLERTKNVLTTQ